MPKRKDEQQFLFSDAEVNYQVKPSPSAQPIWEMDRSRLEKWKVSIAEYQHGVRQGQCTKQGELFDLVAPTYLSSMPSPEIDPFCLRLHNFFFFDRPSDIGSDSCLYFAIDTLAQIILYIGQTCKVDRRWSNQHDCKRYVDNYKQLHFTHGMPEAIAIAFYWEVPQDDRLRRQLELNEILKWRSPFNKENWALWSAPFAQ
ncbi:GIY-YIG nuclease family protein [Pseudanabaena sp. PCC 6802]|uniref:GIY-YIG nuclease family protein n=1 Tax=Pseudanabaena sp. PCC 6802 TaxID=118173 RepID=UPI00034B091F|nr:GIY-YIG nuclease family protein [Pseudanabaena sp. PCC 6802]